MLSAKDLEHGGVVVPVGRPPIATKPPRTPSSAATSPLKASAGQAANPSSPVKPPSVKLYDPTQPRAKAAPSASSGLPALAPAKRVERLPPVDRPPPPIRDLRQEPIPFYPGTGF
jgi:hypothetical protein